MIDEPAAPSGPTRRAVVSRVAATTALCALAAVADGPVTRRYAFAAERGPAELDATPDRDVLVVVSLRGGFDGLSAVVPAGDPEYLDARPTIAIRQRRLLQLDGSFGLHPAMAPLSRWWRNGQLAIVHAVGQVDPSRSHFRAMEELERAAPGSPVRTGWLDRTLGLDAGGSAFRASQVGSLQVPTALTGPVPAISMHSIADVDLAAVASAAERVRWTAALTGVHSGAAPRLARPAATTLSAVATAAGVDAAVDHTGHEAAYPDSDLGAALREVARLVRAQVGLQVACVDAGGWDLHAGAGDADNGPMAERLGDLAASLDAFARDLGPALDGVTVVTLSEFGRRVAENGSGGTDHGHGNAVFLLGGGVRGGQVYGRWPGLDPGTLTDGDLAGTTDYRLLLGEILQKRCGVGSLSTVFPGLRGDALGVLRSRS